MSVNMGKHRGGHHRTPSSSSHRMHMYPVAGQMQPAMQMQQPVMQRHPVSQGHHVQPGMHMQPGNQVPGWQQMQHMPSSHQAAHECMSDTTLEFGGAGSGSDYSDAYSDSASSSRTRTKTKHKATRKRKSMGRTHRTDRSKKAKKDKKKDKAKGSSSDDHDAATFPGTTYRFLGGKELPGSSSERAKQSYPKSHKVAILKEMCSIITVTRPAGGVIHVWLTVW